MDPGSFRDPSNRVFRRNGAVYRALDRRGAATWARLAETDFFRRLVADGKVVATEPADVPPPEGDWELVLAHEPIPVVSYPYEWPFAMLKAAALLQLDVLDAALAEGWILKDATPYNVQFRGTTPTFIDVGSFEPLGEGDVWMGHRQFLTQFLYPLLVAARTGVPFQPWLRGRTEGIEPAEADRLLRGRAGWSRDVLLHVRLVARAERRASRSDRRVRDDLARSGFSPELIAANVARLRRAVERLEWRPPTTGWSGYAERPHVAAQRETKRAFVERHLGAWAPRLVWDLGTNDGHFARLAARHADQVVALDADAAVVDDLYRALAAEEVTNVLPLLQDLADPSPGLGWRRRERPPLDERARPDAVLALAVVHHLVVGRNLPLAEVVAWLGSFDARVVLEWVPPFDPMVEALTRNKRAHEVHRDYTEPELRRLLARWFDVVDEVALPDGDRRCFALVPRT